MFGFPMVPRYLVTFFCVSMIVPLVVFLSTSISSPLYFVCVWANVAWNKFSGITFLQNKVMHVSLFEPPHDKNQQRGMCAQRRLRSAWASAQSDQSFRGPHEETLGPYLPIECTAKTLTRLGGCPGWSESSLDTHATLLVLSWGGSFTTISAQSKHMIIHMWSIWLDISQYKILWTEAYMRNSLKCM